MSTSEPRADRVITLVKSEAVSEYGDAHYFQYLDRSGAISEVDGPIRTFCMLDVERVEDVLAEAEQELLELAAWCVFLKNQKLTGRG